MERYIRHTVLPWFGPAGQEKLRKSSVLIVGCGGTGCVASSFLARAGIGRLCIVDPDVVSTTDLHRQILFTEDDIKHMVPKVLVAAKRLAQANREVDVEPKAMEFNASSAGSLIENADLIVDCSDNFETRMLVNDVCLKHSKPWVHGACVGSGGIVVPFPAGEYACYRCIVDHIPDRRSAPTCEEVGILGPVAGITGGLEAVEALRMLVAPQEVQQRIIYFDSASYTYETVDVRKKYDCPACVGGKYEFLRDGAARVPQDVCEGDLVHVNLGRPVDLKELHDRLSGTHRVEDLNGVLRITTLEASAIVFPTGRVVVKGMADAGLARRFLDDLLGS